MAQSNNSVFTQDFNFKKKVKLRNQDELEQLDKRGAVNEAIENLNELRGEFQRDDKNNKSIDYSPTKVNGKPHPSNSNSAKPFARKATQKTKGSALNNQNQA